MTGRRSRLRRLERVAQAQDTGDMLGIFEADPQAGVWREVGQPAGARGRVMPLNPADLSEAARLDPAGGGLLMVAPFYPAKFIAGVRWADL